MRVCVGGGGLTPPRTVGQELRCTERILRAQGMNGKDQFPSSLDRTDNVVKPSHRRRHRHGVNAIDSPTPRSMNREKSSEGQRIEKTRGGRGREKKKKKKTKRQREENRREIRERHDEKNRPPPPHSQAHPPVEQCVQVVYFFLPAAGAGAAVFTETLPRK